MLASPNPATPAIHFIGCFVSSIIRRAVSSRPQSASQSERRPRLHMYLEILIPQPASCRSAYTDVSKSFTNCLTARRGAAARLNPLRFGKQETNTMLSRLGVALSGSSVATLPPTLLSDLAAKYFTANLHISSALAYC